MPLPIQPIERERPMLSLVWISRGWFVYLESDTMAGKYIQMKENWIKVKGRKRLQCHKPCKREKRKCISLPVPSRSGTSTSEQVPLLDA